jgi:excisionase family DNA binding protein
MTKLRSENLPPLDVRQRYTIDESAAYLRESRSRVYEKIADGTLKTIKDGRRRYIPGSEIARQSTREAAA